jgi:hypothetical protein
MTIDYRELICANCGGEDCIVRSTMRNIETGREKDVAECLRCSAYMKPESLDTKSGVK